MSNPTRRTAIAITALASTVSVSLAQAPPQTTASQPPAEIQSLIDSHIKAFNTQDNNLLFSVFGNTAIIIDGIAPYPGLFGSGHERFVRAGRAAEGPAGCRSC